MLVICVRFAGQLQERRKLLHVELLRGNRPSLPWGLQSLQLLLSDHCGCFASGIRWLGEWLDTRTEEGIISRWVIKGLIYFTHSCDDPGWSPGCQNCCNVTHMGINNREQISREISDLLLLVQHD